MSNFNSSTPAHPIPDTIGYCSAPKKRSVKFNMPKPSSWINLSDSLNSNKNGPVVLSQYGYLGKVKKKFVTRYGVYLFII